MARSNKVLVIGLDGVPFSLVSDLMEKGIMPSLRSVSEQSRLVEMKVSLPEVSAVSWTGFMTGSNPGTHGIFGFTDLKPYSYELVFPLYAQIKVPTIWDRLGSLGKRSIVINQPATYPVRRIDGVMISGFVAVDLFKSVFPARYIRKLRKNNYLIDIDTERCRKDHSLLFEELDQTLESRKYAVDLLWNSENWDFFELVITGTDRLQHYLFDAIDTMHHPYHDKVMAYYRKVDALIGDLVDRFQNKVGSKNIWERVFILSDHGFCPLKKEVYLNTWLRNEGYLFLDKDNLFSLSSMKSKTLAFALDPGRIYLHTQKQFPMGTVQEQQVPDVLHRLKESLFRLEHDGLKVVNHVYERDEIYSGPMIDRAPHLLIQTRKGFDARASFQSAEIFRDTDLTGMHTADDAFCINGRLPKEGLNIEHLAQLVLQNY